MQFRARACWGAVKLSLYVENEIDTHTNTVWCTQVLIPVLEIKMKQKMLEGVVEGETCLWSMSRSMSHTQAVKHLKLERCEISEGLQISGFISVHSVECVVVSIVTVCSLGTIKKLVESMSRWRLRLFSTRGRSLQCPIKAQSRSYKLIIIVTVMKLLCFRGCGVGGNSDTNTSSLSTGPD